jgi:hypothetical protein
MKTKFFTLLIAALSFSSISFARLFRVGYVGPLVTGVDFADAQAAHDAASDGDTLQFYPGTTGSGSYTISTYNKKLVLIGNGYFINDAYYVNNTGLNMLTGTVALYIIPTPGSTSSDGTIIEGFNYCNVQLSDNLTLSNLTITRCNGSGGYFFGGAVYGTITLVDCKITECFNVYLDPTNQNGNVNLTVKNLRVENCKLNQASLAPLNPASTFLINNCIFDQPNFGDNNVVVQNCILLYSTSAYGVSNTVFNNNIFDGQPIINGSNNQFNVNVANPGANVFVGLPTQGAYSEDAKYQLTATSPAKGAGIGGVDLGPFGGANPYRLSGIAAIPTVYKLQAATPNATTNPYPITVSVRSNN